MKECKECGECCRHVGIGPLNMTEDIERWVSLHDGVKVVEEGGKKYLMISSTCSMLLDNHCVIYHDRPELCKQFPKGVHHICIPKGCSLKED